LLCTALMMYRKGVEMERRGEKRNGEEEIKG
jgi:hypothetical protein